MTATWPNRLTSNTHRHCAIGRASTGAFTWLDLLVPNIAVRLGATPGTFTELRARAIVASALACVETATETWVQSNGEVSMERPFDEAVAAVLG